MSSAASGFVPAAGGSRKPLVQAPALLVVSPPQAGPPSGMAAFALAAIPGPPDVISCVLVAPGVAFASHRGASSTTSGQADFEVWESDRNLHRVDSCPSVLGARLVADIKAIAVAVGKEVLGAVIACPECP